MSSNNHDIQQKERHLMKEDFEVKELLGEGTFSEVYRCTRKHNPEIDHIVSEGDYAVKIISKAFLIRKNQVQTVMTEKKAMILFKDLENPFLIRLYATFQDQRTLYFLLQYCDGGDLHHLVMKNQGISVEATKFVIGQVLLALKAIHQLGVLHRDVKPENLLLKSDGNIVLADFGTCKVIEEEKVDEEPEDEKNGEDSKKKPKRKNSFVGTPEYMSPEIISSNPSTSSVDIWALGCCVYFCMTAKHCFRGESQYLTFQNVLGKQMEYPEEFPDEAREFCEFVLVVEPEERPTLEDVFQHPFLQEIDFESLHEQLSPLLDLYPEYFEEIDQNKEYV